MKKSAYFLPAGFLVILFLFLLALPAPSPADEDDDSPDSGMQITPSVLNMKSWGKFITAHIVLPEGYSPPEAADVQLHAIIDDNDTDSLTAQRAGVDFFGFLNVKFSRKDLKSLISSYYPELPATVPLSVTIAYDNETLRFTDSIRVKSPGKFGKGNGNGNGNGHGNGNGGKK